MKGELVELSPVDVELDVRDPKASPDDAYRIYVTTGARSLRKTADLLGVPHGTVLSWSQRYAWSQRIRDTDLEVTEGIADAAAAAVVAQQLKNVKLLAEIRDNEGAQMKDRLRATTILMEEFKDVSAAVANRASKMSNVEELAEEDMQELVQTPEGVAQLLARQRARTGRG